MKTKIVYALISDRDFYPEQVLMSITSLRLRNPDAQVALVTDRLTDRALADRKFSLDAIVDERVTVDIAAQNLTGVQRSRWLKTSLRQQLAGDFLFLDADTVICGQLDEIDGFDGDMGAVWDVHAPLADSPYRKMVAAHAKLLDGAGFAATEYFNTGVIYAKDNQQVREFYRRWHEEWKRGTYHGLTMDQPAFNRAQHLCGNPVKNLPADWNCQLKYGLPFFNTAKIIHLLTTKKEIDRIHILLDDTCYEHLQRTGEIGEQAIAVLRDPLKHFHIPLEIIGKGEMDLKMTETMLLLRTLYFDYPPLFRTLEQMVVVFLRIKRRVRSLFR
jgi:hypothetical protein